MSTSSSTVSRSFTLDPADFLLLGAVSVVSLSPAPGSCPGL